MKRIFAAGCIALLLFSFTAMPLFALTPTYTVTGTYKSSTYHQNVQAITKTGDLAHDTVAAAMSQLDYHEGNSSSDFNGENASGTKNYTEYNRAIGKISGSYSYAWCAAFVSWCLDVAGAKNSAGGTFTSCTLWVEKLQALGLYSTRSSGYVPKAGDLIFFRSSGVTRASDHVGLVRYVKNGRVYTIEGNSSNKVALRDYKLTDTYIVGYGKPQYSGKTLAKTAFQLEDKATGLYTVTYDFVNLRAAPNASATKYGSLPCGTLVQVEAIENGWGRITYQEKAAYISLEYADFTTPVFYTVSYQSEEAEGLPARTSYFSFETATVSNTVPEREGFIFSHWENADGKAFTAGDTLPAGNVTLNAVFTPLPAEETPPEIEDLPQQNAPPISDTPIIETDTPNESEPLWSDANTQSSAHAAARAASVITGVIAATLGLFWYSRKYLR